MRIRRLIGLFFVEFSNGEERFVALLVIFDGIGERLDPFFVERLHEFDSFFIARNLY